MSDYIPFEIYQTDQSIVQFRSVCKQWKFFIDNPKFIKTYHINHPNPQHHLLLQYNRVSTYTSIIDDDTFPKQKFSLTTLVPFNKLRFTTILGSVNGLLCFYGLYNDIELETLMVVLWNPSVRKCVGIPISNVLNSLHIYIPIGFGVCPYSNDPKLVKINVIKTTHECWDVQVFTLSSRVWRTVYTGVPFTSCDLCSGNFSIDGIIYWCTRGNFLISFDLKSEKFGEVCLPDRLAIHSNVKVVNVNESIGLLEYNKEGGMWVCGVWMKKDGVNKPFTKIYTVKVEGKLVFHSVLGFRNNGEAVIEMVDKYYKESQIEVYEPSSGRTKSVQISGDTAMFDVWSYMETLLLLDESNSIIH